MQAHKALSEQFRNRVMWKEPYVCRLYIHSNECRWVRSGVCGCKPPTHVHSTPSEHLYTYVFAKLSGGIFLRVQSQLWSWSGTFSLECQGLFLAQHRPRLSHCSMSKTSQVTLLLLSSHLSFYLLMSYSPYLEPMLYSMGYSRGLLQDKNKQFRWKNMSAVSSCLATCPQVTLR